MLSMVSKCWNACKYYYNNSSPVRMVTNTLGLYAAYKYIPPLNRGVNGIVNRVFYNQGPVVEEAGAVTGIFTGIISLLIAASTLYSNYHNVKQNEVIRDSAINFKDSKHDLVEQSRLGKLDRVEGRDKEALQAARVLLRRNKGAVLFTGEPGAGKSSIVYRLAHMIAQKDPRIAPLHGKRILQVDANDFKQNTGYVGQFETRMKRFINDVSDPNVIVFIDEAHSVMNLGSGGFGQSNNNFQNMMKPPLQNGQIRMILCSTDEESSILLRDRALARRFQKIWIAFPDQGSLTRMIRARLKDLEDFHRVTYSGAVIDRVIQVAGDKKNIDLALTLLDDAAAGLRLSNPRIGQPDEKTVLQEDLDEVLPRQELSEFFLNFCG